MKDKSREHVVIAGGRGMIGSACAETFRQSGYAVYTLTRRDVSDPFSIRWDPATQSIEQDVINGAHAVINVTGVSIADHRWTKAYKRELIDSRVLPATYLQTLMMRADNPPPVYIGASAIGIYGNSGAEPVSEDEVSNAPRFITELTKSWEAAHHTVAGVTRVVVLRIGVVMSPQGGFLERLRLPSRFGLYPVFGNGSQILSWIHIDDLTRVVARAVEQTDLQGVFNAVAPGAVSYRDFARQYRSVRTGFGMIAGIPRFVANLVFGELANTLFDSCHASSRRLEKTGFTFSYPEIREALAALEG